MDATLLGIVVSVSHISKSLTGFKLCTTNPNNTQRHATGSARRTQHVTSNNVSSYVSKQ